MFSALVARAFFREAVQLGALASVWVCGFPLKIVTAAGITNEHIHMKTYGNQNIAVAIYAPIVPFDAKSPSCAVLERHVDVGQETSLRRRNTSDCYRVAAI